MRVKSREPMPPPKRGRGRRNDAGDDQSTTVTNESDTADSQEKVIADASHQGGEGRGKCVDATGLCECANDWEGATCDKAKDKCESSQPCGNGAACTATGTGYACACPMHETSGLPKWAVASDCKADTDECAAGVCKNGAACDNYDGDYECSCVIDPTGTTYTGPNCDQAATAGTFFVEGAVKIPTAAYFPSQVRKTPSWPRSWANFHLL